MKKLINTFIFIIIFLVMTACKTVTTNQIENNINKETRVWISSEYIDKKTPKDQFIYISTTSNDT